MENLKTAYLDNSKDGEITKERMKPYRWVKGDQSIDELQDISVYLLNATGLDVHIPKKQEYNKRYTSNRAIQMTEQKNNKTMSYSTTIFMG